MVQLNLLPDIKLSYVKAQRAQRLTIAISGLVTGIVIIILIITAGIYLAQKKIISDNNNTINSLSAQLTSKPDINKILTVQNQLSSINSLDAKKPAIARLFTTYLDELTPASVSLNTLSLETSNSQITLDGTADSLTTVNQFIDTLKFTTYNSSLSPHTAKNAFKNIVMASFGVNPASSGQAANASFTINFMYDPSIFDNQQNITLNIPKIVTTRSDMADPGPLFNNQSGGGL